jgi:DNA repair exonuclease SbcCD ATPase subunit
MVRGICNRFFWHIIILVLAITAGPTRSFANEIENEYQHLSTLVAALESQTTEFREHQKELNAFRVAWNNGTYPPLIQAKKVLTDFNGWVADRGRELQSRADDFNQQVTQSEADRKAAFERFQVKVDTHNKRVREQKEKSQENDQLYAQIQEFQKNLNSIIAQANNRSNSESVRAGLRSQIEKLRPELEDLQEKYQTVGDEIRTDGIDLARAQQELDTENDELVKEFDDKQNALNAQEELITKAQSDLEIQSREGASSAEKIYAEFNQKVLAKYRADQAELATTEQAIIARYGPDVMMILTIAKGVLEDGKSQPNKIITVNKSVDQSYAGAADILRSIARIAELKEQLQLGQDRVVLTEEEAVTLKSILENDRMLQGLGNAGVGLGWINDFLSKYVKGGPAISIVLKWNDALIKQWRDANTKLASIAKAKNCEDLRFVLIENSKNESFFERLYNARGCDD